MRRRFYRRYGRPVSRKRKYRWLTVNGSLSVNFNTVQLVQLLSPITPPTNSTDAGYQSMTMPTLTRVTGHVTVVAGTTYTLGTGKGSEGVPYAWGMYVDPDVANSTTCLFPQSQSQSNAWMVHRQGYVSTPVFASDATRAAFAQSSLNHKRWELNLSKYKRKLDSLNDTFVFVFQNAATSSPTTVSLTVFYFFRMLFVE